MEKNTNTKPPEEQNIENLRVLILEKELLIKEKELNQKNKRFGALEIGIVIAIISLLSNALVSYLNGRNEYMIERHRLEANLILNAVGTGNFEQNKKNLSFLVDAGLITLYKTDLKVAINDPETRIYIISDMSRSNGLTNDSTYTNINEYFKKILEQNRKK